MESLCGVMLSTLWRHYRDDCLSAIKARGAPSSMFLVRPRLPNKPLHASRSASSLVHRGYNNFIILSEMHQLQIDLMVLDMEFRTYESMTRIGRLIAEYATKILSPSGRLIYKKFGSKIFQTQRSGVSPIGSVFNKVPVGLDGTLRIVHFRTMSHLWSTNRRENSRHVRNKLFLKYCTY